MATENKLDPKVAGGLNEIHFPVGVRGFFCGRDVLVTGGTGYIGKVILEKMLRSCPDVGSVFVVLRSKKGVSVTKRLEQITGLGLFRVLKMQDPTLIDKLVAIEGDMTKPGLGISQESRARLASVSVIIHAAASVRFDEPLRDAVFKNLRGTRDLLELAMEMKELKSFVHVSTAYSNCYTHEIEERVYPSDLDWNTMIRMAENVDQEILQTLTKKLLGNQPNTYTFTKFLAESAVSDYKDKLPVFIFRPSIVSITMEEPFAGWTDSLNGPIAPCLGVMMGVVRVLFMRPEVSTDYIPCDVVVKGLLLSSWYRGCSDKRDCPVVNAASNSQIQLPPSAIASTISHLMETMPANNCLWYPFVYITANYYLYMLLVTIFHIIPGAIMDVIIRLYGINFSMMKLYRKIFIASNELFYFATKEWTFSTDKFKSLQRMIPEDERDLFGYDISLYDAIAMVDVAFVGSKVHVLKEDQSEDARRRALIRGRRLYWLHCFLKFGLLLTISWWLIKMFII